MGIAASQAARDCLDRREGDRNRFQRGSVRKVGDSENADSCPENYVVTSYFVTGWRERLSMMWSMMPYSSAWVGSRI